MNTLFFGDNLRILDQHIDTETVDLVYLDPPFNSDRDYNVLFREKSGGESPAQIKAFGDTWNWAGAKESWSQFPELCPVPKVIELMHGFHNAIGENDVMAYLVMMAPRLYQLHRVLKPTGSLYLHCDPTASHYLKLILDCIFSPKNFRNEIVWKRTNSHNDPKRFGRIHDIIFYYAKNAKLATFHPVYTKYSEEYLSSEFRTDESGRVYKCEDLTAPNHGSESGRYEFHGRTPGPSRMWRLKEEDMEKLWVAGRIKTDKNGIPLLRGQIVYLDEKKGNPAQDLWNDVLRVGNTSNERLGYPTQKPLALLERIIEASTNEGDTVLDPFCGCGTAVVAAQKSNRKWIGIDITPIATSLVQKRLYDSFGLRDSRLLSKDDPAQRETFKIEGLPTDMAGARLLYDKEPTHKDFEMWAVGLIPAIPQEKKGADRGIDGIAYFQIDPKKPSKAVVQVKGGHVQASQIRDLIGVMHTQKAQLAFFISMEPPSKAMKEAAAAAGYYEPPSGFFGRRVEAVQIRTIEELLEGKNFHFPVYDSNVTYQQSQRVATKGHQAQLEIFEK